MTTIPADEIRPGDVVVDGGRDRRITHVDRRAGWAWPIAVDGTGWAIALGRQVLEVHRTTARRPRRAPGVGGWADSELGGDDPDGSPTHHPLTTIDGLVIYDRR